MRSSPDTPTSRSDRRRASGVGLRAAVVVPLVLVDGGRFAGDAPGARWPPGCRPWQASTPNQGPTAGGTSVKINGTEFVDTRHGQDRQRGYRGDSGLPNRNNGHDRRHHSRTLRSPGHRRNGTSERNNPRYTYIAPPTVTSVEPSSGTTAGGTTVKIKGSGFGATTANNTVTIGGATAAITTASSTSITVTTPVGSAGPASVVVTKTTDGLSGENSSGYTYIAPPTVTEHRTRATGTTARRHLGDDRRNRVRCYDRKQHGHDRRRHGSDHQRQRRRRSPSRHPPAAPVQLRVVVTNTTDSLSGENPSGYTYIAPPTVVTKAASAVTQTTATLNATVNPEGAEVTKCEFEYGTTKPTDRARRARSNCRGRAPSPVAVSATLLKRRAQHDLPLQDLGDQRGRHQQRLRRNVHHASRGFG